MAEYLGIVDSGVTPVTLEVVGGAAAQEIAPPK
jgi:hypothetical protein